MLNFTDVIDGICLFTEKLEFNVNKPTYEFLGTRMKYLDEEVEELRTGIKDKNDIEIIDGGADSAFVAIGQIYIAFRQRGFSHTQAVIRTRGALLEVVKTNLTKTPPTEQDVKIRKPEGWVAPDFEKFLKPVKINVDDVRCLILDIEKVKTSESITKMRDIVLSNGVEQLSKATQEQLEKIYKEIEEYGAKTDAA